MKNLKLLQLTGLMCILFTIGHLTFPLMPYWNSSLEAMEPDMKYIFLSLHYVTVLFLAGMAFILTFQTRKLVISPIGQSVMLLFSSLFIIRIVTELSLWKASMPQAAIILPICIFPATVLIHSAYANKTVHSE